MKRIVLVVFGVAALAAGGYFGLPYLERAGYFGSVGKGPRTTGADSSDGESRSAVTALGRLEPITEIVGVGIPAGSRVDRLGDKVKEGAFVKRGEPLAYLDSYPELVAARDLAQAQLDEAKVRLEAETAFGLANVEIARLEIRFAEEVLPRAIAAQAADLRRSQVESEKAKLDLKRSERMLNDKAIPQSQHDGVELLARQSGEKVKASRATLEHLEADQGVKLLTGRAKLAAAKAGLVRAELTTLVASHTSGVKLAESRLDRAVVKAPVDGEIIKILTRPGEGAGGKPLLKMGDTRSMVAVAEVYETDIRFVHAGQKATITSKAFPGESVSGVVERVGTLVSKNDILPLDPARDADTRVVEVRVRLDDSRLTARYNQMQVDVTIRRDAP